MVKIDILPNGKKIFSVDCGNLPKDKVNEFVVEFIKKYQTPDSQ